MASSSQNGYWCFGNIVPAASFGQIYPPAMNSSPKASSSQNGYWCFENTLPAASVGQNNPPAMNSIPKIRGRRYSKKGSRSSSRGSRSSRKNTSGSTSGNRSGTGDMASGSASGSQRGKHFVGQGSASGSQQGNHFVGQGSASGSKQAKRFVGQGSASGSKKAKRFVGQIIGNKRVSFIFNEWTDEEKTIMDQELEKLASLPLLKICEQIALLIPHKSIRDVSMRIENLVKMDNLNFNEVILQKLAKLMGDEHAASLFSADKHGKLDKNLRRISNDRQDNGSDLIHQLLQKNAQTLGQICSNLHANKISDNIELFRQSWNNIENLLNNFNINPGNGIMENMPPVPVQINKELFHLVLPRTELAKGTLNPDMIEHSRSFPKAVNENPGNSALCPINIPEKTVFPIQMTHMQSSTVGRVDEELSKLAIIPDKNWEEPFNQNNTKVVPPSPGGDLREFDFYLPDNPNDPDFMTIQEMIRARAVDGSRG